MERTRTREAGDAGGNSLTADAPAWFGGRNSAVSLTFDDGIDSHLAGQSFPRSTPAGWPAPSTSRPTMPPVCSASVSRSGAVTRSATTPSIICAAARTAPKPMPGGSRT